MAKKALLVRVFFVGILVVLPLNILVLYKLDTSVGAIGLGRFIDTAITRSSSQPLAPQTQRTFANSSSLPDLKFHNSSQVDADIWPTSLHNDRIIAQLNYEPYNRVKMKTKVILSYNMKIPAEEQGNKKFIADSCPVQACVLIDSKYESKIDAVVFKGSPSGRMINLWSKSPNLIKIWYNLESPFHSSATPLMDRKVNWTATYRTDSTIVTPYEKFVQFSNQNQTKTNRNYAAKKSKMVAWFVTNCRDKNGRLKYAKELKKYIDVDIFGACGNLSCPRRKAHDCFEMLNRDYKFYLSFENSACRDYISEKLYWNALQNDVVPIVMGAHPDDYKYAAPPHSFIHVDDFESPRDLANFLLKLDSNDSLYNEYFAWKGTGSFINTKFWCRVCAMLHAQDDSDVTHWYPSVHQWAMNVNGSPACLPKPKSTDKYIWSSWKDNAFNTKSFR